MTYIKDNLISIIKLLSSIKKDEERKEVIEAINRANKELLEDDVKRRRMESSEIIKELARLDMALEEFEINYEFLKNNSEINEIQSIDEYIITIKKYRKKLVEEKRKISKNNNQRV